MSIRRLRVGVVTSHPIQYQAPWFRALAEVVDLHVYFAQQETAEKIAANGYGMNVEWDIDLFGGYESSFLKNVSDDPSGDGFGSCDTPSIASEIGRSSYDAVIVNGWYLKSYVQTVIACQARGIPVLVRGDSRLGLPTGLSKRLVKRIGYPVLLRMFAGCLYVGQRNREYLAHYGVPSKRLFQVPHIVDNDRFATQAEEARATRRELRARLGFSDDDVVAMFVGRLVAFKRPLDLVAAVQKLDPSLHVKAAFVGSGPLDQEIRAAAADTGTPVSMLGFRNQTELPSMYVAADVLVLPSDAGETWGLVVNEAMACGTPVVASNEVGCTPDMIDPGQTGESFDAADIDGLAAAITRIIPHLGTPKTTRALREKMRHYSIERAVEGTLEALDAVTSHT